jgi:hypothetical protein
MSVLEQVVEFLRYVSFGAFLLFGVMYQLMTSGAWRRRPEGIWLMSMVFLILEVTGLAVARTVWGLDYWGRIWFQLIVGSQLALLPIGLIVLLLRAQVRAIRIRREAMTHPRRIRQGPDIDNF